MECMHLIEEATCTYCTPRTEAPLPVSTRRPVNASYEYPCRECGRQIRQGDLIAKLDDSGDWVHATCADCFP